MLLTPHYRPLAPPMPIKNQGGYWMLAEATGNYSLTVQDCATNPDDIDTAMWWMVEDTTEGTPEHAVEVGRTLSWLLLLLLLMMMSDGDGDVHS